MVIINLYAGRGGRFFSISKQAGRTVECRMIDECAGRRRLDERMYAVPGETPMGRIFSVGRQSIFLVSPGESKSIFILSVLPHKTRITCPVLFHLSLLLLNK